VDRRETRHERRAKGKGMDATKTDAHVGRLFVFPLGVMESHRHHSSTKFYPQNIIAAAPTTAATKPNCIPPTVTRPSAPLEDDPDEDVDEGAAEVEAEVAPAALEPALSVPAAEAMTEEASEGMEAETPTDLQ